MIEVCLSAQLAAGQYIGAKDEGITREPKEGTQVSTSIFTGTGVGRL